MRAVSITSILLFDRAGYKAVNTHFGEPVSSIQWFFVNTYGVFKKKAPARNSVTRKTCLTRHSLLHLAKYLKFCSRKRGMGDAAPRNSAREYRYLSVLVIYSEFNAFRRKFCPLMAGSIIYPVISVLDAILRIGFNKLK
jgi:hypothetical protein